MYIHTSLSLSLYIYIYIYIHEPTAPTATVGSVDSEHVACHQFAGTYITSPA